MSGGLLDRAAHHGSDLINRIALASTHPVLFHGKQLFAELQHFFTAVVGFDVHDDQVTLAVLGEKNRLSGFSAQIGDLVVVLTNRCRWTDIHKSTSCS